jgi:hypothetical protein
MRDNLISEAGGDELARLLGRHRHQHPNESNWDDDSYHGRSGHSENQEHVGDYYDEQRHDDSAASESPSNRLSATLVVADFRGTRIGRAALAEVLYASTLFQRDAFNLGSLLKCPWLGSSCFSPIAKNKQNKFMSSVSGIVYLYLFA